MGRLVVSRRFCLRTRTSGFWSSCLCILLQYRLLGGPHEMVRSFLRGRVLGGVYRAR